MDLVLLGFRLILAATLVVSGIAKLLDLAGSRAAVSAFNVPRRLVPTVAVALPLTELGVALLLLFSMTALPGAATALVLFTVFTVAIGNQLRQGNAPACHCFGALSQAPVGPRSLVRNGALIALATAVIALGWTDTGPGLEGVASWSLGMFTVSVTMAAGVALAALGGLFARRVWIGQAQLEERLDRLARSLGGEPVDSPVQAPAPALSGRPSALAVGTLVPSFRIMTLDGELVSAETPVARARSLALLLSTDSCLACRSLLPEVRRWQRDLAPAVDLLLVGRGSSPAYQGSIEQYGIAPAAIPDDDTYNQVMLALGVERVPTLVVIGPDGHLSHPIAGGVDEIHATLMKLAGKAIAAPPTVTGGAVPGSLSASERQTPAPGAPVPQLTLQVVGGGTVSLTEVTTRTDLTLVLFWRSDCPHCQGLNATVRAWREGLNPNAIQVVAISPGATDDVGRLGIADLALTDPDHHAHNAFGVDGSPSAILLDRSGQVASALVGGSRELDIALRRIRGPLVFTVNAPEAATATTEPAAVTSAR